MNRKVIPVKTGIHNCNKISWFWIPAFAGMTKNGILQQSHPLLVTACYEVLYLYQNLEKSIFQIDRAEKIKAKARESDKIP